MAIFGRFTQRAQRAVAAAQQAAVLLHQPYVGTEHILLGLLKEPGPVVADVLPADVNYDTVLERVRALLGEGNVQSGGMLELTPRSKKILESSIMESRKLHHSFVGTEHFWLALLKEGEGVAVSLLRSMGVDTQAMQQKILEALVKSQPDGGEDVSAPDGEEGKAEGSVLEKYSRDLTKAAQDGELDPVIGRSTEIERIMQIMSRRTKNNPVLIGEPGVGKSTMLLQLCGAISNQHSVLYITGEESVRQVKLRAARLKVPQENIYLAAENDVDEICGLIEKEKPELVVIDSIQTMRCMDLSSSAGTVSQVKESAARLLAVAKKQEIPMFIVGHVNKDGAIAGPKVMEHIVDTVLYFEGDKMLPYRILRAAKNRYGSTNELGMFDMTGQGLEEIENPSQMLLEGRPLGVSGNCVACTMEGSRPILSEIQALATKTNFPAPRRACSGYDYNRMNLLIAVLEKRAGYFFGNLDVYINIVGGIALRDTACDLAVCLCMVSSLLDCPVSDKLIAIGEVGLGGEVRSVPNLEQRLREAERIGFERAVVPKHSLAHLNAADYPGMKLVGAAYISDAIHALKSDRL